LFKPDTLAPTHAWQGDPLLSPAAKGAGFLTADWTAVPKVGFERVVFRQLEEQPSARVFDDSVGFELANYERPSTRPAPLAPAPVAFTVDANPTTDVLAIATDAVDDVSANFEAKPAVQAPGVAHETPAMLAQDAVNGSATSSSDLPASAAEAPNIENPEPSPDPLLLAQWREQAFQEGLAQGRSEGLAQGLAEGEINGRAEGESAGERRGIALGQEQAQQVQEELLQALQEQMQAQVDTELHLLRDVSQRVEALVENPQALYEPLKRLALHMAEQLVLAELTLSGSAIERLVQRCLDELDFHGQGLVTIELNPQDKARLEEKAGDMMKNIQLQAVAQLKPGSVRVIANDTQVEDLVQTRLQALAHSLLGQPEVWREQSSFFKQPLSQRDTEVTDAAARDVVDPRQVVDARHLGDIEHG
jgi:flagellar biosynthesis/type III secretory pathway protein FliH